MESREHGTPSTWTPERVSALSRSVAILLLGGIALGMFAANVKAYYIGAAIGACLLVLLVSWQFETAVALYCAVAFVPWGRTPDLAVGGSGVGKGVYVSEAMLGFVLAIWLGKYLMGSLPENRPRSGFHVPIALYLAYCVLNVVHSFLFWDVHVNQMYQKPAVNVIELGLRFLSAGAFVMMATTVTSRKWLGITTAALVVPGVYSLVNGAIGNKIPVVAPWWPLMVFLPAGYAAVVAMDGQRVLWHRLVATVFVAAAIAVLFVRNVTWVSGWLGLFVTLGTVTLLWSRKAFAVALVAGCLAAVLLWPFLNEKVVKHSQEEGDYDRFALMRGAVRYARTFPLGVGLGNYRTYNTFHYGEKWETTAYTSAHGTYSQHLSETGFPGAVLFLWILGGGLLWLVREARDKANERSRLFLVACTGQIAGIAAAAFIGDYIVPTYHNGGLTTFSATVYSWMIWGLAVAHVRLCRQERDGSIDIHSKLEYAGTAGSVPGIGV